MKLRIDDIQNSAKGEYYQSLVPKPTTKTLTIIFLSLLNLE